MVALDGRHGSRDIARDDRVHQLRVHLQPQAGDVVEVEIDRLGTLRTPIVGADGRAPEARGHRMTIPHPGFGTLRPSRVGNCGNIGPDLYGDSAFHTEM
jgi:hypothetical protein